MSGIITGVLGRRGGGKTVFITYLGYLDYLAGRTVVANYHLEFPHRYATLEEIASLPKWLRNCTVLLDEVQVGADSREIFKLGNKALTTLATQLRKRNVTLYFTTQIFGQVDKRLRDQTDYVVFSTCVDIENPVMFNIETWDYRAKTCIGKKLFYGKPYFSLYDTNEVILYDGDSEEDYDFLNDYDFEQDRKEYFNVD